MQGKYLKIIGIKFDPIEGLEVVADSNARNFREAAEYAEKHGDENTIFIGIPCTYIM